MGLDMLDFPKKKEILRFKFLKCPLYRGKIVKSPPKVSAPTRCLLESCPLYRGILIWRKCVIRWDPAIVSAIERCLLYSMSAIDRYDCILLTLSALGYVVVESYKRWVDFSSRQ